MKRHIHEKRGDGECGAILILLALLAVIIVMFAALVIDLGKVANEREQAQHYSRLAALGALEAHYASTGPTLQDRLVDAEKRAQQVSGLNVLLSDKQGNTPAPSRHAEVSARQLGNTVGADLIPGRWVLAANGADDPCGAPGKSYPCFAEIDTVANPDARITAYQVRGKIFDKLSTTLAKAVFNTASFPVDALATATVVPRRGCFIVDLSASTTRVTHVLRSVADQNIKPLGGRGSEFVYTLSNENPGEPAFQDTFWQNVIASGPNRPADDAGWTTFLNGTSNSGTAPDDITQQQYRRMHFRSDYTSKLVLSDNDYANLKALYETMYPLSEYPHPAPDEDPGGKYEVTPGTANDYQHRIHVDKFRKPSGVDGLAGRTYNGAQPLQTVFAGLRNAMDYFQQRQVAGDAACIMFVDSRLWYTRFIRMTDNFDYLKSLTDFTIDQTNPISDDAGNNIPVDSAFASVAGFELLVRHGMLPIGAGASKTNLSLAVIEAMNELQRGNSDGFASNFITVITDGLGNCRRCTSSDTSCPDNGYFCDNSYPFYKPAMRELRNFARDRLQGKNIPFHWILVGDTVAPHTMNIKNASGKCMSDEEARMFPSVSMVKGGWDPVFSSAPAAFAGMSPEYPFYEANLTPYQIAVGTRGLFGPIRPLPDGICTPTVCTGDKDDPSTQTRLTTDPDCRTEQQQIDSYMLKIIGDNPYTVVEAR